MRALSERITLLSWLTSPVAFASLRDVAVLSPALAGRIYESENGLDQSISGDAERNQRGCSQNRLRSDTVFVAKYGARSESSANGADKRDE